MKILFENVLAVLVIYKCALEESTTFLSLRSNIEALNSNLELLVYDNSPEPNANKSDLESNHLMITYIHDKTNPGLNAAYNEGLKLANVMGREWLLLLDQDTVLTKEYLLNLDYSLNLKLNCVSFLPYICQNERLISPTKYDFLGRMIPIEIHDSGKILNTITAINSGNCINVEFVNTLGGFTREFNLDMLDHWLFYEISKNKKDVYVLPKCISHNLSVNSLNTISTDRYEKILDAEFRFNKFYLHHELKYKSRLALRMAKLLFKGYFKLFKVNFKYLFIK